MYLVLQRISLEFKYKIAESLDKRLESFFERITYGLGNDLPSRCFLNSFCKNLTCITA